MGQPRVAGGQGGSVSFCATDLEAREAVAAVMALLGQYGLSGETLSSVEIALSEVVNNIVEHAYAGARPGQAGIDCELDNNDVWLSVWDHGREFPDGDLPPGNPVDVSGPPADLPEGGFGWFLIRSLAQDVAYRRGKGVNRLMLRFARV